MKKYASFIILLVPIILHAQAIISGARKVSGNASLTHTSRSGDGDTPNLPTSTGWHKLTGTIFKRGSANVTPCPPNNYNGYNYPYADSCQNVYNAWSGAIADIARNRLLIWGGGHDDYGGNEVYSLELNNIGTANPVLIRLTPPSPPNTQHAVCVETLSDGRPNSRHTYDGLAYLPNQDELIAQSGSLNDCGFSTNATWTLSLSSVLASCAPNCTSSWTHQNPAQEVRSDYDIMTAYDTVNNLLWANDSHDLWSYDPVANNWTHRGSSFSTPTTTNGTGVHDPVDQYFINIGGSSLPNDRIVYFSTKTVSTHAINRVALHASCAGILTGPVGNNMGSAWDPIDHVVVIYPDTGNVLYMLNPKTWTCTTETYGSVQGTDYPQNTASGNRGTFKRFNYFPKLDVFVLCNDPYNDCWILRRRAK
jgi:hypothetical protein